MRLAAVCLPYATELFIEKINIKKISDKVPVQIARTCSFFTNDLRGIDLVWKIGLNCYPLKNSTRCLKNMKIRRRSR